MPAAYTEGDITGFGDVDADGTPDLLWGVPRHFGPNHDYDFSGAVWVVLMNPDGSAKSASRIANGEGGLPDGVLEDYELFGSALSPLGDVNGDGFGDLGVLSPADDGRLWVLFLDATARVLDFRVVGADELDMTWRAPDGSTHTAPLYFALEGLPDMDGDGVRELAVHAYDYNERGGIALAFLGRDGELRKRLAIGNGEAGLPDDPDRLAFGSRLSVVGDLDLDGSLELAAGDPYRTSPAVSILSLDPSAFRNGSGVNRRALSQQLELRLGRTWKLMLDCTPQGPGFAVLLGTDRALDGVFVGAGELLVDPRASRRLFQLTRPYGSWPSWFDVQVPNDLALLDLTVHTQGLCTGAPGPQLSNAIDALLGR